MGVRIPAGGVTLEGDLEVPSGAVGIVLFVHGSGSSRLSPRNRFVARQLREAGLGTLLFDLLTKEEETEDLLTGHLRFDIGLLAHRLLETTAWLKEQPAAAGKCLGYFGSSTGAAAALVSATMTSVVAVVSRGGRPDLAGTALGKVRAPTLLLVGGEDELVVEINERALAELRCEKLLRIIPGATHLFEEPGKLEEVGRLAGTWFSKHFKREAK